MHSDEEQFYDAIADSSTSIHTQVCFSLKIMTDMIANGTHANKYTIWYDRLRTYTY
jgi:hypothetical protein